MCGEEVETEEEESTICHPGMPVASSFTLPEVSMGKPPIKQSCDGDTSSTASLASTSAHHKPLEDGQVCYPVNKGSYNDMGISTEH